MSDRAEIETSFWSDPDVLALSGPARAVYFWSFTNHRTGYAGLFKVAREQVAMETGFSGRQLATALDELQEKRFLFYDGRVMFVRTRVKRIRTKFAETIAKSIAAQVRSIGDHPHVGAWWGENGGHPWATRYIEEPENTDDGDAPRWPPGGPHLGVPDHITSHHDSSAVVVDVSNSNVNGISHSARKPRVDQTAWPDELSPELRAAGGEVLAILRGVWEIRGGSTEPQQRGVGLGMLRNPRADHVDLARRMQHWFLAGKGQRAATGDIAKRFGDWCAEEPAGKPSRSANGHGGGALSQGDLDARRLASMRKLMSEKGVKFA